MPLYEFRCPRGHAFEKFYRSIGSAPNGEKCPECGVVAERLMSAAGLVFKGSGFYITDYGKDGKKAEREAANTASTNAAKSDQSDKSEAPSVSTDTQSSDSKSPDKASTKSADSSTAAPGKSSTESKPAPVTPKPSPALKKSE